MMISKLTIKNIVKGNTYKVINESDSFLLIENEKGFNEIYLKRNFIKLSKVRKFKIHTII